MRLEVLHNIAVLMYTVLCNIAYHPNFLFWDEVIPVSQASMYFACKVELKSTLVCPTWKQRKNAANCTECYLVIRY